MPIAHLPERAVLQITGADRVPFLQGLVSNDVARAAPGCAVWAALLTPQGKWLADMFILSVGERLLLDVEASGRAALAKLLGRYRLRAQAAIEPVDLEVHAAWGEPPTAAAAVSAPDPRLPDAGWRVLGSVADDATAVDYDAHRLRLGLPDGSRDLLAEQSTLVESGFDELGGIDWQKGCYMGQELTARTKYRGLVKRRLVPVRVSGALPPPGTPVTADGAEVGSLRSGRGERALASLRVEAIGRPHLACGEAVLTPEPPGWLRWRDVRIAAVEG